MIYYEKKNGIVYATNGPILKFKFLFTLKFNFNWDQFYKNISKFCYFKKWTKVIIKL